MNRRNGKKLMLSKETLRNLQDFELRQVGGGAAGGTAVIPVRADTDPDPRPTNECTGPGCVTAYCTNGAGCCSWMTDGGGGYNDWTRGC